MVLPLEKLGADMSDSILLSQRRKPILKMKPREAWSFKSLRDARWKAEGKGQVMKMSSREFEELREQLMAAPVMSGAPIEESRAAFEKLMVPFTLEAETNDVKKEEVMCGDVPGAWIMAPGASDDRVVMYLHGGGFSMGSIESHLDILCRLSRSLSARVLAIEYRLAPEHPFPAAIEDCVHAYRWLLSSGVDARRAVIVGSSAGAGLVMSTLLVLRDGRDRKPAAAACLCPFADMTLQSESLYVNEGKDWVTRSRVEEIVDTYLAGADPHDPLASPALADLSGLPPIFIQAGRNEILVDDARRLAAYASSDGVHVELDIWPEMIHIWQLFAAKVPEGREAIEKVSRLLKNWVKAWS